MSTDINFKRICLVVCFTPKFENGQMPAEINQEELAEQCKLALDNPEEGEFTVWGSRGGMFEKLPEGHTYETAVREFDKHIIEMLFGEKVSSMASTPQGRLALMSVVQMAQAKDDQGSGAVMTEVGDDTPTKQ